MYTKKRNKIGNCYVAGFLFTFFLSKIVAVIEQSFYFIAHILSVVSITSDKVFDA